MDNKGKRNYSFCFPNTCFVSKCAELLRKYPNTLVILGSFNGKFKCF